VDVDPRPNHLNSVSISYSHLFPRLYDFIWYESYRLTSIFDFLPIIFWFTYPFATSIMIKIKMPTNIHRVPFFFFIVLSSFHIFSSHTRAISLLTHTWVSLYLCQDDMLHCHCFLYPQIPPTQFSLVEKKICSKRFHAHSWLNFSHSSRFWPKFPMFKFRP
jgi:hypothetical protein